MGVSFDLAGLVTVFGSFFQVGGMTIVDLTARFFFIGICVSTYILEGHK